MPGYASPPSHIRDVMRAPAPPRPYVSPGSEHLLMVHWTLYPSIDRLSRNYLRLAGLRIEPQNHGRRDTPAGYGIKPTAHKYELIQLADSKPTEIRGLPSGPLALSGPSWSSDGKLFAFRRSTEDTVELWIGDGDSGEVKQVPGVHLNAILDDDFVWLEGHRLIVKTVSKDIKLPAKAPTSETGPAMQESLGGKGQSSTYEVRDTLTSVHDENLFDFYVSSQLAIVDADALKVTPIGQPDRYLEVEVAPDNQHVLISSIQRPYSYITTYDRFPRKVEVWKVSSKLEHIYHVADLSLADRVPVHGVRTGPRNFFWRANVPCELFFMEALDEGDWKKEVEHREKIMSLLSPFDKPKEVMRLAQRFHGIIWGEGSDLALVKEYNRNKLWRRGWFTNVDKPSSERVLYDMSMHEKYGNPGHPVTKRLANGARVMRQEGDSIFLAGEGASPQGDRPFLDRLELQSMEKTRLFRSDPDCLETFLAFEKSGSFLTERESPSDHPNIFRRQLGNKTQAEEGEAVYASETVAITRMTDPTPVLRQIKKRLVTYKRDDGLSLSFKILTPPGYNGGRIPTILYAYPLDYADAASAAQTSGSEKNFVRLRKHLFLLLSGYAIIEDASFPIIGDPKNAYDTYLEQLVANAKAAVDEAVRIGVADPDKIGVTGHSHGAFMTSNLLIHSDLFKAGVATSGAYNKIITSFGFQNERRSLWEAPELYAKVSPYHNADKLKAPLLVVHGTDDANPGTTPFQSKLYYEALRGNGAVTRLLMLPHEPHWYAAQESNEHLVYEMLAWFDKYVKGE